MAQATDPTEARTDRELLEGIQATLHQMREAIQIIAAAMGLDVALDEPND